MNDILWIFTSICNQCNITAIYMFVLIQKAAQLMFAKAPPAAINKSLKSMQQWQVMGGERDMMPQSCCFVGFSSGLVYLSPARFLTSLPPASHRKA